MRLPRSLRNQETMKTINLLSTLTMLALTIVGAYHAKTQHTENEHE